MAAYKARPRADGLVDVTFADGTTVPIAPTGGLQPYLSANANGANAARNLPPAAPPPVVPRAPIPTAVANLGADLDRPDVVRAVPPGLLPGMSADTREFGGPPAATSHMTPTLAMNAGNLPLAAPPPPDESAYARMIATQDWARRAARGLR